jgi:DNA polymerase-3 subunit gamma/tau
MSYVVLARKYRPRSFDQMVGQEHVVRALSNALEQNRLHHAYLFTGTRGIGKTTVSRILAKSLNCTGADGQGGITAHPCGVCSACTEIDADRYIDYIELDAASNRSIDEIRDLIERAAYKPGVGRFKVFMIDEAHQLTKDAFNALLKTLEEPPEYLKFVLATTDPEKMLPTVLSRCLQFNLRPMAPETVQAYLAQVLPAENVGFDEGALRLISRSARGSMRDALSLTDQAIAYGGGKLDEGVVRAMLGSVDRSHARGLVEALARRDGPAVLDLVDGLRSLGLSASATLEEMAQLLQQMAVEQAVPGALDTQDPELGDAVRLSALLPADETQLLYSIVLHGRAELGLMSDEYGALTMVLLRMLAFPPASGMPPQRSPAPRAAPLRAPAPPAIKLAVLPPVAPVSRITPPAVSPTSAPPVSLVPPAPVAGPVDSVLGDRWVALVTRLAAQGTIVALARELAWQAGLLSVDDRAVPAAWTLQVERESLRSPVLRDKLSAALAAELGTSVDLVLVAGAPDDSPARREAAERGRRQALAEETIRADPVVQALLEQYRSARIVPGSIKPA